VRIAPLPGELSYDVEPVAWALDGGALTLTAGPRTDLFVDPGGAPAVLNAPRLLTGLEGDFLFGARVRVEFAGTYDAGVLLLWRDDAHWAKLCFERSPQAVPTIVSVVTRGASDDANAFTVDGAEAWLRIARLGRAVAFHASTDGTVWQLIRYFELTAGRVGFLAQSPTGEGCTVTFDRIFHAAERLADLRSGA
jgi:regulation of enolase protein 1 (concanavalin A-like superfamily)